MECFFPNPPEFISCAHLVTSPKSPIQNRGMDYWTKPPFTVFKTNQSHLFFYLITVNPCSYKKAWITVTMCQSWLGEKNELCHQEEILLWGSLVPPGSYKTATQQHPLRGRCLQLRHHLLLLSVACSSSRRGWKGADWLRNVRIKWMHNWNKTWARISEVKFLAIKLLFNVSFLLFGLGIQTSASRAEETKKCTFNVSFKCRAGESWHMQQFSNMSNRNNQCESCENIQSQSPWQQTVLLCFFYCDFLSVACSSRFVLLSHLKGSWLVT